MNPIAIAAPVSLDVDPTVIMVLALFLIPLVALNALVIRPFLGLLEERHDRVEGVAERARQSLLDAEAQAAAFSEKMKVATQEGIQARDRVRAQTEEKIQAKVKAAQQAAEEKSGAALKEIQKTRDEALAKVESEAQTMAATIASKLLGRKVEA